MYAVGWTPVRLVSISPTDIQADGRRICSMISDSTSDEATERKMLLEHIQLASRHVAESDHRIARQRRVIAKLRMKQQTTATAEWFLTYLQTSRVVHLAGLTRLQRELSSLDGESGRSDEEP